MTWWVVICRLEFDDEDSVYIVPAGTKAAAIARAKAQRLEDAVGEAAGDRAFFWNYAIACDTEPRIVGMNV